MIVLPDRDLETTLSTTGDLTFVRVKHLPSGISVGRPVKSTYAPHVRQVKQELIRVISDQLARLDKEA